MTYEYNLKAAIRAMQHSGPRKLLFLGLKYRNRTWPCGFLLFQNNGRHACWEKVVTHMAISSYAKPHNVNLCVTIATIAEPSNHRPQRHQTSTSRKSAPSTSMHRTYGLWTEVLWRLNPEQTRCSFRQKSSRSSYLVRKCSKQASLWNFVWSWGCKLSTSQLPPALLVLLTATSESALSSSLQWNCK